MRQPVIAFVLILLIGVLAGTLAFSLRELSFPPEVISRLAAAALIGCICVIPLSIILWRSLDLPLSAKKDAEVDTQSEDWSAWRNADEDILIEVIRQAECRLQAQLTAAIAADQRAMAFANTMTAISLALGGAAWAAWEKNFVGLSAAATTAALMFYASAFIAWRAAQPSDHEFIGHTPSDWHKDIKAAVPLNASRMEMAKNYDGMLRFNDLMAKKSSRYLPTASKISLWAPFAAVAVLAIAAVTGAMSH